MDAALISGAAVVTATLHEVLSEQLALSRAQARRLIARGSVRLVADAQREAAPGNVAKGTPLRAGETIEVAPHAPPGREPVRPEPEAALCVLAKGAGERNAAEFAEAIAAVGGEISANAAAESV